MAGSHVAEAQPRPRPGRPRSEESRTAVLRATSELLHEVGLRAMTTEEIASRSEQGDNLQMVAQQIRRGHRRVPVRDDGRVARSGYRFGP